MTGIFQALFYTIHTNTHTHTHTHTHTNTHKHTRTAAEKNGKQWTCFNYATPVNRGQASTVQGLRRDLNIQRILCIYYKLIISNQC